MKREPGKMTRRRLKIDAYGKISTGTSRQNLYYTKSVIKLARKLKKTALKRMSGVDVPRQLMFCVLFF